MGIYKNVLCSWFLKTGKNPKVFQQERSTVMYAHIKWKLRSKTEGRMRWGDRRWDGWTASPTQWTWVWANFRRRWRTGKPGVLRSTGSQRVRHDWTMTTTRKQSIPHNMNDSQALYWAKEVRHQRGHTVWFHLSAVLEQSFIYGE